MKTTCSAVGERKPFSRPLVHNVAGLAALLAKFQTKVTDWRQKVKVPLPHYSLTFSQLAIHFNDYTEGRSRARINDYWIWLSGKSQYPSESYFKFTVYALALPIGSREWMTNGATSTIKRSKLSSCCWRSRRSSRLLEAPKLLKTPHSW